MTDKTLKSKKQAYITCMNNQRESRKIQEFNSKINGLNKVSNYEKMKDILDSLNGNNIKHEFTIDRAGTEQIEVSLRNKTLNDYRYELHFDSKGKLNDVKSYNFNSIHSTENLKDIRESADLIIEASEKIAKEMQMQVPNKVPIANPFDDLVSNINIEKIKDDLYVEERKRNMVGKVLHKHEENTSFTYGKDENGKSIRIPTNEWSSREIYEVCTSASRYEIKTAIFDPESKKKEKPQNYSRIGKYFYEDKKLQTLGDKKEIPSSENFERNIFIENIEPPEFIKSSFPAIPKPEMTFDELIEEYQYRVVLNYHENNYRYGDKVEFGKEKAEDIEFYKDCLNEAVHTFKNPSDLKKILKENGINSEADLNHVMAITSLQASKFGIEKSAEQLIKESEATLFAVKEKKELAEGEKLFSINSIKKELHDIIQTGNYPEGIASATTIYEIAERLNSLEKKGETELGWIGIPDNRSKDKEAVMNFFEKNGAKVYISSNHYATIMTPEKYKDFEKKILPVLNKSKKKDAPGIEGR